jgi:hypothetical protein
MKRITTAVALAATLAGALPAEARERGRDRRPERHRHHDRDRDDDTVGGFLLGALLVGGIAAAIGSKKKTPVAEPAAEEVAFVRADEVAVGLDEDAAVAACAVAAEEEGRRRAPLAQAGQVTGVEPDGAGLTVRGAVRLRGSWAQAGVEHPFRCLVDAAAVRSVTIGGAALAAAR